ncbi:MAG: hypothetical protein E6J55_00555 [Deltaproteobacteria bacterium]|nr:MAG: hypothetical protein E6J55_00555 [Deltaproteobacteria bacterium]
MRPIVVQTALAFGLTIAPPAWALPPPLSCPSCWVPPLFTSWQIQFTGTLDQAFNATLWAFVWPARHQAGSSTDPNLPPMGLRLRLKASLDISGFSPANQVILAALKRYGMFVADNGGPWFVTGAPDPRWDDDDLHRLGQIIGADFEAVDESGLMVGPDSGHVR